MRRRIGRLGLACLGAVALAAASARAADLVIGRVGQAASVDPLFSRSSSDATQAAHIFDQLVTTDPDLSIHPGLALSWRNVDPLTWEIKLREGVTFHDGSPFTAQDVLFSIERARNVPNSPASWSGTVGIVASATAVDDHTLRITTRAPTPLLMDQIGSLFIISSKAAAGATTADFNSGKAAIGTGPYMFRQSIPGDRVVLAANPHYWGKAPAFGTVTIRTMTNDATRMAALLTGEIDVADQIPAQDVGRLTAAGMHVVSIATGRVVYLAVDSARDKSPFVTDLAGHVLEHNPLRDRRVRLALSKMIGRKLLVERLLDGAGEPAGQLVPQGIAGYDPQLTPPEQDLAGATALLAEAGYKQGFGLTIHTSNDRFPGDARLGQAVGQMLARGGLKVNGVAARPYNVYASEASRGDYSLFVFTFGTTTPSAVNGLRSTLETNDPAKGTGAFNRTHYSNPAFDATLETAVQEFDDAKRAALLQQASRIAFEDVAIIPLYWQKIYWATRPGLSYVANRGEMTTAMDTVPTR